MKGRWASLDGVLNVLLPALASLVVSLAPPSAAGAAPMRVASTLDGKTVLPHRIRWDALPTVRPATIAEVEFRIDRAVRWIDRTSPYGFGGGAGYLVTSWLSPGRHRFTVRVITHAGRAAAESVVARVLPAPETPAALAGRWQRTVGKGAGNAAHLDMPAGRYTLAFTRRWIQARFPGNTLEVETGRGRILDADWTPAPTTFHVQGMVTFAVYDPHTDRQGGVWCGWDGPGADYLWSVAGNTLTLAPVGGKDACAVRGFVWTGRWTRVG